MSGSKKQTLKIHDQMVDLKETTNLYGRLMILTRSNRDIDQKNVIGNNEFKLTPRALFAPDGSMLPCTDKSKLIHSLEKLARSDETNEERGTPTGNKQDGVRLTVSQAAASSTDSKIAIVNGMVLVQKMT